MCLPDGYSDPCWQAGGMCVGYHGVRSNVTGSAGSFDGLNLLYEHQAHVER